MHVFGERLLPEAAPTAFETSPDFGEAGQIATGAWPPNPKEAPTTDIRKADTHSAVLTPSVSQVLKTEMPVFCRALA